MEDDVTVKIDNLSFKYSTTSDYVLKDVNLEFKEGEFVLMIGPSGCGKTTLVNCINGIIPHIIGGIKEGKVYVKGQDVDKLELKDVSQLVGTVFQNPETQFFTLSVLDEIVFGPENLKLPKEEIGRRLEKVVKAVGIEELLDKDTMSLSGGQKQRVAIASVLAMEPDVLILDEPTTNLDPKGAIEVLETVKQLKEKTDSTIILIEHRLEEVAKHADRLIVMDSGRIIANDEPRKIFGNPDLLYRLGIRPPQSAETIIRLKERGIFEGNVETPLSVDEAVETIRQILKNRKMTDNPPKLSITSPEYEKDQKRKPLIEIDNLWHQYPDGTVALRGISLTIHEGEFVGIIGQNGSGKTTLVSHLLGLLYPSHGSVKINGRDVRTMDVPELAQQIGFIFQNPDLMLFQTTVWNEIAFGPRNLGLDEEEVAKRVKEAIKMMKLTGFENRHPHALSRGQRHRVAVASILAMRPKILIADEPTTGQDYGATKHYLELLEKMNKQGSTIIVISHDMKLIAKYVRRVIVLKEGRVLMDGPTRAIFSKPEILSETDIEPPHVTQISLKLDDYNIPPTLTIEELVDVIENMVKGS
jgi:energy-coupling factor transport system ATP-binding protein